MDHNIEYHHHVEEQLQVVDSCIFQRRAMKGQHVHLKEDANHVKQVIDHVPEDLVRGIWQDHEATEFLACRTILGCVLFVIVLVDLLLRRSFDLGHSM
jgi:predicted RNA binding protein YcfA (HicA-like mRNA interferase family)